MACSLADKNTDLGIHASIHLWWSLESGPADLELGAKNTETFVPSSVSGLD